MITDSVGVAIERDDPPRAPLVEPQTILGSGAYLGEGRPPSADLSGLSDPNSEQDSHLFGASDSSVLSPVADEPRAVVQ